MAKYGVTLLMFIKRISWVFIIIGLTIGLTIFVENYLKPYIADTDTEGWGVYFSAFGVVFAIVSGFVLIEALNRYSRIKSLILKELNSIEDIRDFLIYFKNDCPDNIGNVKKALAQYTESLITHEWENMKAANIAASDSTTEIEMLYQSVANLPITDIKTEIAFGSIVAELAQLTTTRTERFAEAVDGTPKAIKALLYFNAIALVLGIMFVSVHNFYFHMYMNLTCALSIYFLIFIINDLDNPFKGFWKINPAPIESLLANLKKSSAN